jgi:predicted DNA-binding protein (MmcQ/YjbR family)
MAKTIARKPKSRLARPGVLDRVRRICLSPPETSEKRAWGAPTFRVRGKMFAMYVDNHHDDGRVALWCNATVPDQALLVATQPDRCFIPPYVGPRGWVGVRVDGRPNWRLISDVVEAAYRLTAPKPRKRNRQDDAPRPGRRILGDP